MLLASCGGGSSAPAAPTTTPPSNAWSVTGRITTLDTGSGVAGATVTPQWALAAVTADGNGTYKISDTSTPPSTPLPVTISGDGIISHDVFINWARGNRAGVDVSVIHDAPPFSMDYYKQLVRGTFDADNAPWPTLRWVTPPSFYIRTIDDAGTALPQSVIDGIVEAINRAVPAWSGGQYAPAAIQTGTDVRAQTVNWINIDIKQNTDPNSRHCGQSLVGGNPGQITFWENVCPCAVIPGEVVVHEVGHAMGFFHVNDKTSLMNPIDLQPCPNNGILSSADSFHSTIAYSRARGNTDPDKDPSNAAAVLRTLNPRIWMY